MVTKSNILEKNAKFIIKVIENVNIFQKAGHQKSVLSRKNPVVCPLYSFSAALFHAHLMEIDLTTIQISVVKLIIESASVLL